MVVVKSLEEFRTLIKGDKVLVEFTAEWSTPCKVLDITLEEIEAEHSEITFIKVDADRFRTIAKDYSVVNVPVVCIFANDKLISQKSGLMRKEELLDLIQQS